MKLLLLSLPDIAQRSGIDTSSAQYQLGKTIGSWIPFILLAALFILMLRAALRRDKNQ